MWDFFHIFALVKKNIMVVVHMETLFDTVVLSRVYEGLDCTLFHTPSRRDRRAIRRAIMNDDGPVVLLGHGTPRGLLADNFWEYVIDSTDVELLRQRTVIGFWCYASEFADRYDLHGFFTSMFVSNMNEAVEHQVDHLATEENIAEEMELFCREINCFIKAGLPMNEWVENLQGMCNRELPFVRYNYEALTYYE